MLLHRGQRLFLFFFAGISRLCPSHYKLQVNSKVDIGVRHLCLLFSVGGNSLVEDVEEGDSLGAV